MDIRILFDGPFWIGITFLGIVVPLFSLAVSLVGQSIERAKDKNASNRAEAEKALKAEIDKLEKQLAEIKSKDIVVEIPKIEEELSLLKKKRKRFEKESANIMHYYDAVKFKKSVLLPGFFLLATIVFSLLAKSTIHYLELAIVFFIVAIIFLTMGIFRICLSLRVIQDVALTSDKYQHDRMTEAIYNAFEKHAEKEKPKLQVNFKNYKPPFKLPKGSDIKIEFIMGLEAGLIAKNAEALFSIPDEFDFPKALNKWKQDADFTIANALTTRVVAGDIRRGTVSSMDIIIRTPAKPGTYKMRYDISCDGYHNSIVEEIEIS